MRVASSRRVVMAALAMALTVAAWGCGDVQDPYTFDPTPITYSETFTGTLQRGGSTFHAFANSISGTITITLVTVAPDSAQTLGIDIGTWNGLACSPIFGSGSRSAAQGYAFAGSAIAGNFCTRIYDADSLIPEGTEVAYSVKVEHR